MSRRNIESIALWSVILLLCWPGLAEGIYKAARAWWMA